MVLPLTKQKYVVDKQDISIRLKSWRSCLGDSDKLKVFNSQIKSVNDGWTNDDQQREKTSSSKVNCWECGRQLNGLKLNIVC